MGKVSSFLQHDSWTAFNIEEMSQITVSRFPGGASFGDNAFVAAINFETFIPKELDSISAKYLLGSQDTQFVNISHGSSITDSLDYSTNVSMYKEDGFDKGYLSTNRYDYRDAKRINLQTVFSPSDRNQFSLYLGYQKQKEGESYEFLGTGVPEGNNPDDPLAKTRMDVLFDYNSHL